MSDTGFAGLRTKCNAALTVSTAAIGLALPTLVGSRAAQWAGSTERSRGRLAPAAFLASLSVTAGYLLLVDGGTKNSPTMETIGGAILVVGTPLILSFADRAFRFLR